MNEFFTMPDEKRKVEASFIGNPPTDIPGSPATSVATGFGRTACGSIGMIFGTPSWPDLQVFSANSQAAPARRSDSETN